VAYVFNALDAHCVVDFPSSVPSTCRGRRRLVTAFSRLALSRHRVFAFPRWTFSYKSQFHYCHESLLPIPINWDVSSLHTLLCNIHSCFMLRQVIRPELVRTRSIARNGRQWVPSLCSSTATRTACVKPVEEPSGVP